jgi:outer membrane usher protein
VQDIAGATSANVQVVLRDPMGAISQVGATMVSPPASTLAAGLSQFDYSVGFARRQLATDSFDYGGPAGILVHRRGFGAFTAGARLEATTDRASGGASVVTNLGRLAIEASLAGSVSELGVSPAAALDLGWRDNRTMFALLMRAVGNHYATIDLGPHDDRASEEVAASAAWAPTKTSSLSARLGFERHSVLEDRAHLSVALGMALGGAHVDLAAGVAWPRELDLSVSITRQLGERTIATGYARQDGAGASVSHAADQNRGLAYDATLQVGSQVTAFARADDEHGYGHVAATASYAGGAARAALEVAGGLVVIGGGVHATRPVQGGFALVRVPGVEGVRAYLDNHVVGTTNAAGDLVVPDMQPFYGNRLRVDVRDLPMDLATGELERIVAPPRRGGSVVAFAAQHAAHVTGTVVGEADLSFGELVVDSGLRAPIGRDGAFELEGVPMGAHQGVVEANGRRCAFAFVAGATETALGVVACVR